MFKEYENLVKLISPAKVDYYYLETGFTDEQGVWNGSIDSYLEAFNGFNSPDQFKEKIAEYYLEFDIRLNSELKKQATIYKQQLFLLDLKHQIMGLREILSSNGSNHFKHNNIIPNQLDKGFYAEFDVFQNTLGLQPFLKICDEFIGKIEISLLPTMKSNVVENTANENNVTRFNMIRKGFSISLLDDLYKGLVEHKLIEPNKIDYNYWFSISKVTSKSNEDKPKKIRWIGTKSSLIYFVRNVIPEETNIDKWTTADSVLEFSKDPGLKISSLISRNDGDPAKNIFEFLKQYSSKLPQKKI